MPKKYRLWQHNKITKTKNIICIFLLFCLTLSIIFIQSCSAQTVSLLDPLTIPKWVNQLNKAPPIYTPINVTDSSGNVIRQDYAVSIKEFEQQILPTTDSSGNPTGFGKTKVWGFEGQATDPVTSESLGLVDSTPGATLEATVGIPIRVKWINNLVDASGNPLTHLFAVDPTIHWANPNGMQMPNSTLAPSFPTGYSQAQSPVPIIMHLHGGQVPSTSDGNPQAWYTTDGLHGSAYSTEQPTEANTAVFDYPNQQQPTTLWYHDHALGITRLNVMSGLAGFYLLRSTTDQLAASLPNDEYEIPLAIQDRNFQSNGQLYFPSNGTNPSEHPYWNPTFMGNTIMVNGKVWPNMDVKQGQYRLRILDGSNSRFYTLQFSNNMGFTQIGSDGGYLENPAPVTTLTISPGERADILVDFSNIPQGQKIILLNKDPALTATEQQTVGQIMQFTVTNQKGQSPQSLPKNLNPTLTGTFPTLPSPARNRTITLIEQGDAPNTVAMLLDGQTYDAPTTEDPQLGTTEDWYIVNPTMNNHPIHLHLIQFQLVKRQALNPGPYINEWTALNGNLPLNHTTINVSSLDQYLTGQTRSPTLSEQCWKDTIQATAGAVTIIRIRFAPQDGSSYTFDPTAGPGYVWHCHILDHEDNEMMRPLIVVASSNQISLPLAAVVIAVVVIVVLAGFIILKRIHRNQK